MPLPHLPAGLEFAPFRPRLLDCLVNYDRNTFAKDVSAGITVGIVALPLAMAFAIGSGVGPEVGLYTAIIGGLIISLLGGSNVLVGGPAGGFIVIVYGIIDRYGLANLLISTVMAGGLMFLLGFLRLGVLVRYIPVSIVIGFTNGIAVLIALSQVRPLLGLDVEKMPSDFFNQIGAMWAAAATLNLYAVGLGLACLAVIALYPRLLRWPALSRGHARQWLSAVPGSMVALVLGTAGVLMLQLPVETVGSVFGEIPRSLPAFALPDLSWDTAKQLLIPTLTITLLGSVEALLTARVADNMLQERATSGELPPPRHDPNQELMGQGVANLVGPFFGCIPATGTIARTVTNIRSGARTPISGLVHALTLLAIVLVAAPLAEFIPLAALAAILMYVAWNMFDWHEMSRLKQFSMQYRVILVGTFTLTVVFDLMVAIEVGLILACVFFVYRMSTLLRIEPVDPVEALPGTPVPEGIRIYRCYGALFFGAVTKVERILKDLEDETVQRARSQAPAQAPAQAAASAGSLSGTPSQPTAGPASVPQVPTRAIILEMHRLISIDTTGVDALEQLQKALRSRGVSLVLADLNPQPLELLQRSGFSEHLGADQIAPDLPTALHRLRHLRQALG